MLALGERKWLGVMLLVLLTVLILPFVFAKAQSGNEAIFSGFLFNPIDGNSYLAKMRQGWNGAWTFVLPYTAEAGEGAQINLYYLFLGHVARWSGLSLIVTFHLARILGSSALFLAIYRLSAYFFEGIAKRRSAFLLASSGAGLGWLALTLGLLAPDLWLAEAFPFLSSYANAHFPLGMALQILLLTPIEAGEMKVSSAQIKKLFAGLVLALVYPFGFVVSVIVLSGQLFYCYWKKVDMGSKIEQLIWIAIGGGSIVIYQFWVIQSHTVLSQWNAQNQTPTPNLGLLIIAFSPVLILALKAASQKIVEGDEKFRFLLVWVAVTLVAITFPSNLQRRLISAIYVPLAILAIEGLGLLVKGGLNWRRWFSVLFVFSVLSNVVVLLSGINAASKQDETIYIDGGEMAAFKWLEENAAENSIVAAAPATGLFLPVYSGLRVMYGHPIETIDADYREVELVEFFSKGSGQGDNVILSQADYIFFGPREKDIGEFFEIAGWQSVFDEDGVHILAPIQ
jgi:hypothetical protein